jgi:hypothetical protein
VLAPHGRYAPCQLSELQLKAARDTPQYVPSIAMHCNTPPNVPNLRSTALNRTTPHSLRVKTVTYLSFAARTLCQSELRTDRLRDIVFTEFNSPLQSKSHEKWLQVENFVGGGGSTPKTPIGFSPVMMPCMTLRDAESHSRIASQTDGNVFSTKWRRRTLKLQNAKKG